MATLYRRLLGDAFDTLPPVLRRFHDQEAGGAARLAFRISHGSGPLARGMAKIARLPEPGGPARGRLRVSIHRDSERWIREINGRRMKTRQWQRGDLLIEAVGPFRLGFRLVAGGDGMQFRSVRGWLLGLPLPGRLAPRVAADVTGREEGWWVDVRVELPTVGLLMRYEGEVIPE